MGISAKSLKKNTSTSAFLNKPEPKPKKGSKSPLFDRLVDDTPEAQREHPKRVILNRPQVLESIVNEVSRLLNTRLSATAKIYSRYHDQDYGLGLPWMYGIPDFTSIDPADKTQWVRISELFKNAISYFEPRLKKVSVSLDHFDGQSQRLYVSIRGQVVMKEFQQPVAFGIEINNIS